MRSARPAGPPLTRQNRPALDITQRCSYGASASPLLANVYLHYVFDLWVTWWRRHNAHGDVIIVRFADDCAPRTRLEVAM
jgi:hypothetical protein